MSLINDLLRDLDARHAPSPGSALAQGEVVRASGMKRRRAGWLAGFFVIGAMAAGGALGGWLVISQGQPAVATDAGEPAPTVEAPMAKAPPAPALREVLTPEPEPVAEQAAAVEPPAPVVHREKPEPARVAQPAPRPATPAPKATVAWNELPAAAPQVARAAQSAAPKPATPPVARTRPAPQPATRRVTVLPPPAAEPRPAPVMTRTRHVPSPAAQDRETARLAREAIDQSKPALAETQLRARLAETATAPLSREMLVGLLLQQGRLDEAERFLVEGLADEPGRPAYLRYLARIKISLGDPHAAIAALEQVTGAEAEARDHRSLLAIARQKLGDHDGAMALYRALLEAHPPQANWWVGLAISLEATGASPEASEAYRQGAALSAERSGLHAFATRRLAVLARGDTGGS